ncbi:MAG: ATP-dependent zinc metalloprotease FtsH [Lachnospiraceae bacterium]|nr:ATP-dependent zinc metalloprotease FtsH [Lachnospiraceae bacterium]MBQ3967813.1 ATP-dependent zinc metalloprotease FtsH [Lachnospiraceae bacterium]MCR4926868.1 ATP-dependent zinc metalloprotease FtsH [Lachnospiraceae bacterium]
MLYLLYIYKNADTFYSQSVTGDYFKSLVTKNETVNSVKVVQEKEVPAGYVVFEYGDGKFIFYVSDVNEIQKFLAENKVGFTLTDVQRDSYIKTTVLPILLLGVVIAFLFVLFSSIGNAAYMESGMKSGDKMLSFGKSRARKMGEKDNKTTFKDVAGLKEEKEEMTEIVDFLKDPAKYNEMGAHVPKGILLEGPPGTGKTLLAKAIAGEAGVPFFSISGSDFVEMFVGVGASRVRDMFNEAKSSAPCIIFIDEIDAVGRRRGSGLGGGHDEREQTLNQLLVEMDGFEFNSGIIVLAATNRVDILDPALLRAGRFDRKIVVGRPDIGGRSEILKVHTANKPLGDDVDLEKVAQTTAGYTGADLENLMNEAAISAVKDGRKFIRQEDIDKSFIKVSIGTEKKSRIISEDEKRITAYHESGHAILFKVLPLMDPVRIISIIPTGVGAAGYTMPLPDKDRMYLSKERILQHIQVCLGGRIAEALIFGDVTTGASQDIKDATAAARSMVMDYGMTESLGMIHYGDNDRQVFVGGGVGNTHEYSEDTAAAIDREVRKIVDDCYKKAEAIIKQHMDVLHKSAALLMERERITTEEFEALFT